MNRGVSAERRQERSDRVDEALHYWLRALTVSRGARAAVVGTTDGLPIASSGQVDPLWLATAGSQSAGGRAVEVGNVHSTLIRLRDGQAVVLSLCGTAAPSEAEVGRHIRRILA